MRASEAGSLVEQNAILAGNQGLLQERIAELELAIEDQGWQRLSGAGDFDFSRQALRQITHLARVMYLKNPLIQRGVNVQTFYVFGQGMTIRAKHDDINEVVQRFLDDAGNQAELTSHQAMEEKERDLQLEGNHFFVFFTNISTGRVRVRTLPFDQIEDVVCNPHDDKEPWFYKRTWTFEGETLTRYYPDWRYRPQQKLPRRGEHLILWESPVYHVKVGGVGRMKFGLSETYSQQDWARAFKSFLEDWATLTKAYSRFAHKLTTKGGARGVQAAKGKLGSTMGAGGLTGERNPSPVAGSTAILGEGHDLEPMRIGGANVSAEDGRQIKLMVAAGKGLPETFYGDASQGNHATAKTLDRPTELQFRNRQTLWATVFTNILLFVIWKAATAANGPLRGVVQVEEEDDGTPRLSVDGKPIEVETGFPPILEHDIKEQVDAITKAAARLPDPLLIARLLLVALGVDDVDARLLELDRLFKQQAQAADEQTPAENKAGNDDDGDEEEKAE